MSFSGMINWIVFTSLETKNTNKIPGIRNLTANCKMHFLLKYLLLHCYHKCQNSGRNIPWWTHKPLPLLPERNCSDSPRAGTVPTVSFSVAFHQLSGAAGTSDSGLTRNIESAWIYATRNTKPCSGALSTRGEWRLSGTVFRDSLSPGQAEGAGLI